MSNGIRTRQNEEHSIEMLVAQRKLYNDAKAVHWISTALSVWIPFVLSILLVFVTQNSPLESVSYILSIISMLVSFGVDKYIKKRKELAASIQQKFDIYVYQMPWNERLFGKNKNLNHAIAEHSKSIMSKEDEKKTLYDWYTPIVDEKHINDGILSCQRENQWWDVGIRTRYRIACCVAIIVMTVIVFGMGIIRNEEVLTLLWRVAFIVPMLQWLIDTVKQLNEDIDNLKEVDEMINDERSKSLDDLQDIQVKIYEHRKGCFAIPDFFYKIFKDNDEDNAHRAALRN